MVEIKNSIKSLLKAVSVMKSFTPDALELGAAEISRKVGLPKTTAHRILATLSEGGLLEQNGKTGKFQIGPALYVLGSLYLSTTDILIATKPVMETLNDLTEESVSASILNKDYVTLVMREEAKYPFRWAAHIGTSIPAYCTSQGKALLSDLTEAELDRLYPEERLRPLTKKTIATKTELKLEFEQIRKTGVAFNREGAYEGIEGISSAIRDAKGRLVAAMGIAVPIFRMNPAKRERLAGLIRLGSSLASYRLGYQDMYNPVREIKEIRSWWEHNQPDSDSQENGLTQAILNSRDTSVEIGYDL